MGKAEKLKAIKIDQRVREPLWDGPCSDTPNGGVTQGLIAKYLVDRERFRVRVMEGLAPKPAFDAKIEFGNMWHVCEETHAKHSGTNEWHTPLKEYASKTAATYRLEQETVQHWYEFCKTMFPIYVEYWSKHRDVTARTPLLQEQEFKVPYHLPSSRTVFLRGKWDAVDAIGDKSNLGIWLQENKTKTQIDQEKMNRQLSFDLQTMTYLVALCENDFDKPLKGVRYNVIKRSSHKSVDSLTKKLGDDAKAGRMGEWFARWNVEILTSDITRFKAECLTPILENLCDDAEWYTHCFERGFTAFEYLSRNHNRHLEFPNHYPRHYRFPFGIYNPLVEGGYGDVDAYLSSGSEVGLVRLTKLFPELSS